MIRVARVSSTNWTSFSSTSPILRVRSRFPTREARLSIFIFTLRFDEIKPKLEDKIKPRFKTMEKSDGANRKSGEARWRRQNKEHTT